MTATTVQFFWQDRSIQAGFRTGVSLHSHTMYSEESLNIISRYTRRIPFLSEAIRKEIDRCRRNQRESLDFSHAFWTPPLPPREAYCLEQNQIERELHLAALVSISDHDNIRANLQLRVLEECAEVPISTEWTVPFGPTFFHIGVHNLPVAEAAAIAGELAKYTASPEKGRLCDLLRWLHSMPDVLLVLNHPLWDEAEIGVSSHAHALGRLLERHGQCLHALEANGLRCWRENRKVIELSEESGHPVVSGGDRHGLEPNAILNITAARTLEEFIHEVRYDRRSHVIVMPHYREPLRWRVLQTILDVVREYPENPKGRRSWSDRVYYRQNGHSAPVPMRQSWPKGEPLLIQAFMKAMRFTEFRGIRSALRLALNDRDVWSDQEAVV